MDECNMEMHGLAAMDEFSPSLTSSVQPVVPYFKKGTLSTLSGKSTTDGRKFELMYQIAFWLFKNYVFGYASPGLKSQAIIVLG